MNWFDRIFDMFFKHKKRICPSCIEEFYPGDCAIFATIPTGFELKEAPTGWQKYIARIFPKQLTGLAYTKSQAYRQCPNTQCNYALPDNIETVRNLNIVIVGDTSSGKSVYIAALIQQIEEGKMYQPEQPATFTCLTENVENDYRNKYINSIFKDHKAPPFTGQAQDTTHKPLIYELSVKKSREHLSENMNLIIYDAAGEDYMTQNRLVSYASYVLNADAIIFLADPASMVNIYDRIKSKIHYGVPPRTATKSFTSIIRPFIRAQNKQTGTILRSVPIAITLSKSDLLKYLRSTNKRYSFIDNPSYINGLDLRDIENVNQEVKEVLNNYGEPTLVNAAQGYDKVKFLAISATGFPSDENGNFPNVEPIRCLDPLLWILHELDIIRADPTI